MKFRLYVALSIVLSLHPVLGARWPNPSGLSLIVGKAALRTVLGFSDVSDLASNADRDAMLARLRGPACTTLNCVVALRDKDLPALKKIIKEVRVNFSLITLGTVDMPSAFPPHTFRAVYNSPYLRAWYTQNLDSTARDANKMHVFPLGIDYHTLAGTLEQQRGVGAKGTFGLAETITPSAQDARVKGIYADAPPWAARSHLLYVGTYGNTHATRKSQSFISISTRVTGVLHAQTRKPRWGMLEDLAQCKFVLAPRGLGMSSIRFYEAIALGSIPICDRLPSAGMNELHQKLGAIIVNSWDEVNDHSLQAWSEAIEAGRFSDTEHTRHLKPLDRTVLTTRFWINCVATGAECLSAI